MSETAHNLRALLSLARLLRVHVVEHPLDFNCELYLVAAGALEQRAHALANFAALDLPPVHETALHARVDLLI